MKQVFFYKDYREYLSDYYDAMKKQGSGFTYRTFSEKGGISSPNYLKLVISGTRNLIGEMTFKFARALELDDRETHFFDTLVRFNQASDEDEKKFLTRRLHELKPQKSKLEVKLNQTKLEFDWYVPMIEMLLDHRNRNDGLKLLQKNFGFDALTATKIVTELVRKGVFVEQDGILKTVEDHTYFQDRGSKRLSFKQYILSQLDFVKTNIDHCYETGKFVCQSLTMSAEDLTYVHSQIAELALKMQETSEKNEDKRNQIAVQMNVQFFPMKS